MASEKVTKFIEEIKALSVLKRARDRSAQER